MDRLYAEDPAQPDAVSLMTIHGAKGLEFDHVFVVGVGLRGRGDDPRLLNWLEIPREQGGDHLVMAPIRLRGDDEEADDDAINLYLKQLHRERARAERARQAYVALTRAKRSLHLFVHPRVKETDGAANSAPIRTRCCTTSGRRSARDVANFRRARRRCGTSAEASRPQRRRRASACVGSSRRSCHPPTCWRAARSCRSSAEQDEIEFSWARQTARRVGTVVHEALERFGRAGLPRIEELPRMRARLESRLQALGVEADARAGRRRARADGAARDARRRAWPLVVRSRPHARRSRSSRSPACAARDIVNAVIDRTFVDADGTRWVVDFKTSPHEGGDRESFLDEEVKRYYGAADALRAPGAAARTAAGARRPVLSRCWRRGAKSTSVSRDPSKLKALRPEASGGAPSVISRTSRSAFAVRPVMNPWTR